MKERDEYIKRRDKMKMEREKVTDGQRKRRGEKRVRAKC